MTTDHQAADSLLEAFRYFNDEMTVAERSFFEQKLDGEVALQEALADIVLLQQALLAGFEPSMSPFSESPRSVTLLAIPVRTIPGKTSYYRILTLCTAALLLFAMIGAISLQPSAPSVLNRVVDSNSRSTRSGLKSSSTHDLESIRLWTIMGVHSKPGSEDSEVSHAEEIAGEDTNAELFSLDEIDVPDWMFAAVEASLLAEEMQEHHPDDDEETL